MRLLNNINKFCKEYKRLIDTLGVLCGIGMFLITLNSQSSKPNEITYNLTINYANVETKPVKILRRSYQGEPSQTCRGGGVIPRLATE